MPARAFAFLSYRQDDTLPVATRLKTAIEDAFGPDAAYLDHRSVPPGSAWPSELEQAVRDAAVVVVLVGHRWLRVHDEHSRRRIDNANDWVRREIETALAHKIPLLPVYVDGAKPLVEAALPPPLAPLAQAQALRLRSQDWDTDVAKLSPALKRLGLVRAKTQQARPPTTPSPAHPAADELLDRYRKAMQNAHGTLTLAGFETRVRVPVQLDELYVPLRAQVALDCDEAFYDDAEDAERAHARAAHRDEVGLAEAFSFAAARDQRGIVLLGDPGAGKTTQLHRMLLATLGEGPATLGLPDGTVPMFLPLRHLEPADLGGGFDRLLARAWPTAGPLKAEDATAITAHDGPRLLLFDGLDEVPTALRARVCTWIRDAARYDPHPSFYAVTSRYAGYDATARDTLGERFLPMHLRPLDPDQVAGFVHNWYRLVESHFDPEQGAARAAERATELVGRLQSPSFRSRRVSALTANPLLLTNVCLVHRDRGSYLPEGRERLYRECLNVMLELWRTAKQLEVPLAADRAREVLQPVALYLHQTEGRTRATLQELDPIVQKPLREVGYTGTAEQFLEAVRGDCGVLTGWSHKDLGFLHLGFQEYLAACEIHRLVTRAAIDGEETPWLDRLAASFGEPWWREVTLLLLALDGVSLFKPLFERVCERPALVEHEELVKECVEEAKRTDPAPFLALLDRAEAGDPNLLERHLVAARVVERLAPEAMQERRATLARSASPELSARYARHDSAATRVQVHESTGIELVPIPGGSFVMGAPDDERGRSEREGPQHEVALAPFWLAKTPVTNEQYGKFLQATGHVAPEYWEERRYNRPRQPVIGVSWEDAVAFCTWAKLFLPSEAQWEYACRAGTETRYWSGSTEEALAAVAWYQKNSDGLPEVGEKRANPWGLFDMHGNVWEWCQDTWQDSYEGSPSDGTPWEDTSSEARVIRGGSWRNAARRCRSAYRIRGLPWGRDDDLGFRPASSRH
ncbi:MAG: SUMF1/EgtB/PvdO family nonheme iron enzyme [Planctomycetota bacterium]